MAARYPLSTKNHQLVPRQLLRQEKDEASPSACAARDSLDAFILRFAGAEGFSVFRHGLHGFSLVVPARKSSFEFVSIREIRVSPCSGLSTKTRSRAKNFRANKLKDQQ